MSNVIELAGPAPRRHSPSDSGVLVCLIFEEVFFHYAFAIDSRSYTLLQNHHQNSVDSSYNLGLSDQLTSHYHHHHHYHHHMYYSS